MPLTCGARSTVNVDQSTVNMDWVSNGLRRASGWAGQGRAGPDTCQAVALPRHGRGPLLGFVHSSRAWAWLTVDQVVLVHGPKAGSLVDQVHRYFPRLGSCAPSARLRCSTRPSSSVSSTARSRRRRTHRRASAAVLAPNWHGKKHRQALATAMVVSGRRLGLPRSLATANGGSSTTGVRGWRGCSGIGRVYGARERHSAPAGMLGRSRGPLGPPVALATAAPFRARRRRR